MVTQTIIDKLDRAEGPDRELDFLIAIETDWRWPEWEEGEPTIKRLSEKHGLVWVLSKERHQSIWRDIPKFSGSIDAAMTLVPEGVKLQYQNHGAGPPHDHMWLVSPNERFHSGASPALALCIAALRARSQGGE